MNTAMNLHCSRRLPSDSLEGGVMSSEKKMHFIGTVRTVFFCFLLAIFSSVAFAGQIVVIVNPSNATTEISLDELKKIFMINKKFFSRLDQQFKDLDDKKRKLQKLSSDALHASKRAIFSFHRDDFRVDF